MDRPNAEDVNYWKTSRSSPDTWLDRAEKLIINMGGMVRLRGRGTSDAVAAYMFIFEIDDNVYKVIWPVLHSSTGNERAALVQAATMLHHDIKAKCISAVVLGARAAFFSYLMLPDGRTAAETENYELPDMLASLTNGKPMPMITEGEIIDG